MKGLVMQAAKKWGCFCSQRFRQGKARIGDVAGLPGTPRERLHANAQAAACPIAARGSQQSRHHCSYSHPYLVWTSFVSRADCRRVSAFESLDSYLCRDVHGVPFSKEVAFCSRVIIRKDNSGGKKQDVAKIICLTTEAKVSSKSTSCTCSNPRTTNRALYLCICPSDPSLRHNTHRVKRTC